jgi:hypothetical protein
MKEKQLKIAMSGTHGTGKTTKAIQFVYDNKISTNKNLFLLQEIARESPHPINKRGTRESHMWIFAKQIVMETELMLKYDMVVCDRTILDTVAYSIYLGFEDIYPGMNSIAMSLLSSYDSIYYFTTKKNNYLINDGIRDVEDSNFRYGVENILGQLYDDAISNKYLDASKFFVDAI